MYQITLLEWISPTYIFIHKYKYDKIYYNNYCRDYSQSLRKDDLLGLENVNKTVDVRREEAFTYLSAAKSFRHLIIYIISLISVFSKKNPINEKLEL